MQNMGAQLWQIRMPTQGLSGCGCGPGLGQLPQAGEVFTLNRMIGGLLLITGLWGMGRVGQKRRAQGEQMVLPTVSIMSGAIILARTFK